MDADFKSFLIFIAVIAISAMTTVAYLANTPSGCREDCKKAFVNQEHSQLECFKTCEVKP